jgi:hypothetical protein
MHVRLNAFRLENPWAAMGSVLQRTLTVSRENIIGPRLRFQVGDNLGGVGILLSGNNLRD